MATSIKSRAQRDFFHPDVLPLRLTISFGKDNVVKCTLRRNGKARRCSWRDQQHDCFGLTEYTERAEQIGGVQGLLRGGSLPEQPGKNWLGERALLISFFLRSARTSTQNLLQAHYAWDTTASQSGPAYFSTAGAGLSKMAHNPS
jgi:hypothetical protein